MSASVAAYLFYAEFGGGASDGLDSPAGHRGHEGSASAHVSAELAARVRAGDEAAFAELFSALYVPLVRFATRYGKSVATAEDAVQDVFAKVWERRAELAPRASVAAYFYNAVRNRVLNLRAHEAVVEGHVDREEAAVFAIDFQRARTPSPEELLVAEELARIARARVATLSPRLREIYRLSRGDGLTPGEIAEVLGTTVQTIYVQLGRIMRALYPALEAWLRDE